MRKALFLDRDGVINQEINYLHRIEDFVFISGVFNVLRLFQSRGYLLIIVTNQAGIAHGMYSEDDYRVLEKWMLDRFEEQNVHIDACYYCPHHPSGLGSYQKDCPNRKPNPGMILRAADDWNIDLSQSVLVGDKESDIQAGITAGIGRCILVRSGHAIDESKTRACQIMDSIFDLAQLIEQKG